jgi:XTP/dITP diphosphohydrolase
MFKTLLIPTTNSGKLKEIKTYFSTLPIKIIGLDDLDYSIDALRHITETGTTFKENAFQKASQAGLATGMPALADDSGLTVDALQGRPGVHSARYAPTDSERISKLLKELRGAPQAQRSAQFICVMCLYTPTIQEAIYTEGISSGYITHKPQGDHGFGYDPIFYSKILNKTFAQASTQEKNSVSHRVQALNKMFAHIKTTYPPADHTQS